MNYYGYGNTDAPDKSDGGGKSPFMRQAEAGSANSAPPPPPADTEPPILAEDDAAVDGEQFAKVTT